MHKPAATAGIITMHLWVKISLLLLVVLLFSNSSFAQAPPANDHFRNAEKIIIPDGGYALGTFQSSKVNLKKATKEAGESIHLLQYYAGTDKKTVWFVFETQTPRNVTVELRQRDTLVAQDAVGITIFRSKSKTQPPNLGEVDNNLTPISKFGSTGNTCLSPDKYYVQVSAKANANAEIWLNLVVGNASPALYDQPKDAYQFFKPSSDVWSYFDVGCQGIDNKNELMKALGPDYNQTTWHTFATDNYSDLVAFTFQVVQKLRGSDTVKMGYRLYKGDAKNAFGSLVPVDSAVFEKACHPLYPQSCGLIGIRRFNCGIDPGSIYSIQLIFHKQAQYSFRLGVEERGDKVSLSANPTNLPAAYKAGVLVNGASVNFQDYFACNSQLSQNLCGSVNPPQITDTPYMQGNVPHIDTFDLSLWSTFEVPKKGVVNITGNISTCSNGYSTHLFRFFKGDVTTDCNLPVFNSIYGSNYIYLSLCLEPGKYSLQVLGRKQRNPLNNVCSDVDLGKQVSVNITFNEEVFQPQAIHYLPSNPEDLGDITTKLAGGVTTATDYFGMPDDTLIIDGNKYNNRFHFKQFYLSQPTHIKITHEQINGYSLNYINLLCSGKISQGVSTIKPVNDTIYGRAFFTSGNPFTSLCTPLPAGWYTIVSVQQVLCNTLQKFAGYMKITRPEPCKKLYNRPYKASYAGDLDWISSPGTPGATSMTYDLNQDCFNCTPDTPFSSHPLQVCDPSYMRPFINASYYVFNLKQESLLQLYTLFTDVNGGSNGRSFFQLYRGDVRTDSLKFNDNSLLVSPCNTMAEYCRLQPGVYTIVALSDRPGFVRPRIVVEKTGISAYDHARRAADIGHIMPNATEKRSGDDLFYCTTGMHSTDPDTLYNNFYYGTKKYKTSVPYPMPKDMSITDSLMRFSYSKNLWYTFTCAGTGDITVNIYPKTPGDQSAVFRTRIYRSNEKGSIPFTQLASTGKVDSTNKQGLVSLAGNIYYNGEQNNTNTITFQKQGCDTARYYVIVERSGMYYKALNNLLQVGVQYKNVRMDGNKADKCSDAELLTLDKPGEKSVKALINCHSRGESYGEDGSNMACLVRDTLPYKTTWFRFRYTGTQKVDLSFRIEENTSAHHSQIRYRVLYGTCNAMTPGPCVENSLSYFKLDCMGAGDYYVQVVSPELATGEISLFAKAEPTTYQVCKPIDLLDPMANFSFTGGCNNTPVRFINLSSAGKDISYAWKFGNGKTDTAKNPVVQYKPVHFADTFYVTLRVTNTNNFNYDEIEIPVIVFKDSVKLNIAKKQITINCGEKVKLEASSNYPFSRYEWFPKEGLDNPYSASPVFTSVNRDAGFKVVLYAEGCILSDSVHIYLRPEIHITGDTVLCYGKKGSLTASDGYTSYYWSHGQYTQTAEIIGPGKYWVRGYTNAGCMAIDTFNVKNESSIIVDLGKDTTVCPYDPVILKSSTASINYLWSTGEKTPQITVRNPGTYWLRMDDGDCPGLDTIKVIQKPLPVTNLADTLILCGNETRMTDIYKPGQKYLWSSGETTGKVTFSKPGKYFVLITENGCVSTDSVEVVRVDLPDVNVGHDTVLCGDFGFLLDAGNWKSYLWQPGNSTERQLFVKDYGRYVVKVTNADGCENSDTILISQKCDPQLWVPNAFTPSNDDVNNTFKPVGQHIFTFEMRIYNRWGELIFASNDMNKGWDGSFKNSACPMDVYIWTISYTSFQERNYLHGVVNLLR